jgi:hypothetical protein
MIGWRGIRMLIHYCDSCGARLTKWEAANALRPNSPYLGKYCAACAARLDARRAARQAERGPVKRGGRRLAPRDEPRE